MFSVSRPIKATGLALTVLMAVGPLAPDVQAAPFAAAGASRVTADTSIVQVQARRSRPVAQAKRRRGNNTAAIGAAIVGIGVLGIAAAAAASQRDERRGAYYSDQWNNPVDAYGRPVYAPQRQVQYYQPQYEPQYEQQYAPRYYRPDPRFNNDRVIDQGYGEPRISRREKEQLKAQERARREYVKQQAREERGRQRQIEYYGQPQYQQPYGGYVRGQPGRNIFN